MNLDWLSPENIMTFVQTIALPGIFALLMLIVAFIVAGWVKRITLKALQRGNVEATLVKFFSNFARYVVLIIAIVAILGYVGIETASFAAVLAAAGFAIGLAFQGTLSNFSAGVMLLVFRPFKVGDVVNVNGITGKVDEIELFTTQMNTFDNRRMIIPNGEIFGSTIENITYHDTRRVDVNVGTDYGADLKATRDVLVAAAQTVDGLLEDKDVQAYLLELGGSSIDWVVRVWVPAAAYWDAREQLTQAIKEHLDEAGIGIPFPQMDLHVDGGLSPAG